MKESQVPCLNNPDSNGTFCRKPFSNGRRLDGYASGQERYSEKQEGRKIFFINFPFSGKYTFLAKTSSRRITLNP